MMYSVFNSPPSEISSDSYCPEECVLDLRIPEKQKPTIYHNYERSPVHNNPPNRPVSSNTPEVLKIAPPVLSPETIPYGCESPNSIVSSSDSIQSTEVTSRSTAKNNRPFKTLTKDPFLGIKTAVELLHKDVDYATFRQKMLSQSHPNYNNTNMNMRRKSIANENNSDPTYWEKRRKNNEAAKKSRDARKAREDEIAIRCAFLEQENLKLKLKIAAIQSDTERMHSLIYRV